jgi:Spy/CpxP family protein refolding chaperone
MIADEQSVARPTGQAPVKTLRLRFLRPTVFSLAILLGGGTAGFALAMGGASLGGVSGDWDAGRKLAGLQFMTRRALDAVGATSDQENRVHDTIASAAAALAKEGPPVADMHKQLAELLKAPTVDRAAVEALRVEMVRRMDARSKIVAGALVEAAGQLNADQRTKLIERIAMVVERRRASRRWQRPWDANEQERDRAPGEAGPKPERN